MTRGMMIYDSKGRGYDEDQIALLMEALEERQQPSDDEILSWAGGEQFFLFCDEDDLLQIARAVLDRFGGRIERRGSIDPDHIPDARKMVEALDKIANLPMDPCSTENDYRLSAAKAIALAAVSTYREQGE